MITIYDRLKSSYIAISITLAMTIITGCKKEWLEAKPQLALVEPSTIEDYQALLDNTTSSSGSSAVGGRLGFNIDQTNLNEISAGDLTVSDASFNGNDILAKNTYVWARDIFSGVKTVGDWNAPYKKIYYTNIINEGIDELRPANSSEQIAWNQVKGSALFFRAYSHYEVAQEFCLPYSDATLEEPGIPLRLQTDLQVTSVRATVAQTYDAILKDLMLAKDILPVVLPNTTLNKLRPTKTAALAMLARVYLSASRFDSAFKYANQALQQYNVLLDYNTDIRLFPYNIPRFSSEVIFHTVRLGSSMLGIGQQIVDSNLYKLYHQDDIRKTAFFFPLGLDLKFVGGYDEGSDFVGLATDELYLIRAECYARNGNTNAALDDLNALLVKRIKSGSFSPVTAASSDEVLEKIIVERRKELCFRGIRWTDLRRLNTELRFASTLTRTVNNQTFTLPPNDPRYVLAIPPDVVILSGIPQNNR